MRRNACLLPHARTRVHLPTPFGPDHTQMQLDPYMIHLGFQGGISAPGEARLEVQLRPEHLNNWGSAHGGFLFSLADSAFALASNSHGPLAVALSAHIEFLKPSRVGDTLVATAIEINRTHRTAVYRIEIHCDATLVAVFTGTVFRKSE
jgi:acyl-CoA thioesterase